MILNEIKERNKFFDKFEKKLIESKELMPSWTGGTHPGESSDYLSPMVASSATLFYLLSGISVYSELDSGLDGTGPGGNADNSQWSDNPDML